MSYSSKDIIKATSIYSLFIKNGIDVWFAPKSIEEGADYGESIINAIEQADGLILLLSSGSNDSDHVLAEVDIAFKNKKPIFPLRLEDVIPNKKLEYRIATKQWTDVFYNFDTSVAQFIQSIQIKHTLPSLVPHSVTQDTSLSLIKKESFYLKTSPTDIARYLSEAIAIDHQYYNEELSGILETCMQWYEADPEIYSFVVDENDTVVAYLNAMLIDEDLFQKIKEGEFLDSQIPSEYIIQPFMPGVYKLYFCSVAIDKKYNKNKIEIFSILYRAFFKKLEFWAEKDFYIEEIIADAVTQDGKNMAQSFGLNKLGLTTHTSTLYYGKMLPPQFKGTKESQFIFKKYKEYYEKFVV